MKRPASLRQLLIAVVAFALLPSFVVVIGAWWAERESLEAGAREQVSSVATLVALHEQRRFEGARQLLAVTAAAPAVRTLNVADCNRFMVGLQRGFPNYANVGVLDLEGRPVCTAVAGPANTRVADRAYFQEALRSGTLAAEYVVGRLTTRRSLTFALPVEGQDGTVQGVVFASLDLERAAERLRSIELPDYLEVFVTTQDGTVLTSTLRDDRLLGVPLHDTALLEAVKRGAALPTPGDGAGASPFELVRTIGDYRPTRVVIAARARTDLLLEPAARRLQLQLAALTVATLIGGALAWRLGHRSVVTPTSRLLARMRRLERDEPVTEPSRPGHASLELAALDEGFSRMQRQLLARGEERSHLLAALQAAQNNVLTAQRMSRLGYWELDPATGRLETSETVSEFLPCEAPCTAERLLAAAPEPDRRRLEAALTLATRHGERIDLEHRLQAPGGAVTWVRTVGELQPAADGRPSRLRGSMQDISERKAAEVRVAAQLARLQLLHQITRAVTDRSDLTSILRTVMDRLEQQMPLDFCLTAWYDAHRHCIVVSHVGAASRAIAERLGLGPGQTLNADANGLARAVHGTLVHEPDTAALAFELPKRLTSTGIRSLVLAPLQAQSGVSGVVLAARRAAGAFSSTDCEFLAQLCRQVALAIHQAELYGALETAYDDLRRSQDAVLQHERLRALGEMASGIAHDINNGISPLTLYIDSLLAHEGHLSDAGRAKLETMQLAVDSISKTVERMRDFYRSADADTPHAPVSLNDAVRQVIELTQARWRDLAQRGGASIDAGTELEADLPDVLCNEVELRDALTNLVFNAVDAMPRGGTLTFTTRRVGGGDEAPAAQVTVSDTGEGMDEETRRRCIEPFFTTKGERGTGLGLAMVWGMMRRHHGTVDVQSDPAGGTSVTLRFPLSNRAAPASAARQPVRAGPVAPMRLLVVDDDPLVLRPLVEALSADGHDVLAAEGGSDAIDRFRAELEAGRPVDAVVTDLGMPHVDGSRVAREVKALREETLVVMLTGWGRRMAEEESGSPRDVDCLLSKPPRLDQLRAALSQTLDNWRTGPTRSDSKKNIP